MGDHVRLAVTVFVFFPTDDPFAGVVVDGGVRTSVAVAVVLFPHEHHVAKLGETWWLWVVAPGDCEGDCAAALHQLRQLHVLLNKDADRVQRALVTGSAAVPEVVGEYPRLIHLRADLRPLTEGIYIVDPIGNLVLHYPYSDAGSPVLEDLKRLLKLSRIG